MSTNLNSNLDTNVIQSDGNTIKIELRVRYAECDPMNLAHHASYIPWLEIARTELLRARGMAYRDLEAAGVLFVVARLNVNYKKPAKYDDVLQLTCRVLPSHGVKLVHEYEIHRDEELLLTAETTLVCLNQEGKMQPVPPELMNQAE